MANIVLSYEGEKSGFVADLVYGPRGTDAVFNSNGSSNIVNQLYAYLNVSDNFTLTLGNWNTFLDMKLYHQLQILTIQHLTCFPMARSPILV